MSPAAQAGRSGARPADDWIERVREANDIVEIVGQTVQLRRAGRSWTGLCPFHQEKTPSFTVSAERQLYHCFSCKAGGDVFKFVQETEKVSFLEAAEMLSRRAGIPVPERRGERTGIRHALHEALELAAQSYEQWLRDPARGARIREYLAGRKISEPSAREFRLGFAPEGWQNLCDRLRSKVSEDVLVLSGLAARRDQGRGVYDRFRNRLIVPLVAPGGQVVGFGARALGDEKPKYLNSPETAVYRKSAFVYGLDRARRALPEARELVVVEGYFDVIALHQAGITHAVATSGTALTADHARIFKRLTSRVALTFDGDTAGREATLRSIRMLLAEGLEVRIVELAAGEDPDTLIRARGLAGWNERRAAAYDPVGFVDRHVHEAALVSGATREEAENRAIRAVVELTSGLSDPAQVQGLLDLAGRTFGMERELHRAVALRRQGLSIETPLRATLRERGELERGVEHELLQALVHDPTALDEFRARLVPDDFRDPAARALAAWWWNGHSGLPEEDPAATLGRELSVSPGTLNWGAVARGAIRNMVIRRLKEQRHDRTKRLRTASGEEEQKLMQELQDIVSELHELTR